MISGVGKYRNIVMMFVLIAACVWFAGLFWFDFLINHYPEDRTTRTDAIIVVTGGRNRISESIRLLNNHLSERLFISGVAKSITVEDILKNSTVKTEELGKIELGYSATNTIENASEISRWIQKNNIKSIRFISSNYHIPRSLAEFSAYHKDIQVIIHPVYSENVSKDWWQSWGTGCLFISEYNKFLFVKFRNMFQNFVGDV